MDFSSGYYRTYRVSGSRKSVRLYTKDSAMTNPIIISMILRAIVYFWISVESFFLYHIYKYGYFNYKPTNIIGSLCHLFHSVAIFFMVMSFATVIGTLGFPLLKEIQEKGLFAFAAMPIGYFLVKFRINSFKELPKKEHPLQ